MSVEPRTSALNMTLPAAGARAPAVIDAYLLPAPRLQQAADIDRRDRQTDGRTPDRYIDPAPRTMRTSAPIMVDCVQTGRLFCLGEHLETSVQLPSSIVARRSTWSHATRMRSQVTTSLIRS